MQVSAPIMVVDDDDDIRELLKVFLEAEGYRVNVAADGLDALSQIQIEPPALILLDLMMPRMDGEEFLKTLSSSKFANIPVIVLSGHISAQEAAARLKATCCLMKPVELNDLMNRIQQVMAAHPPDQAA